MFSLSTLRGPTFQFIYTFQPLLNIFLREIRRIIVNEETVVDKVWPTGFQQMDATSRIENNVIAMMILIIFSIDEQLR